MKTYKLWPKIVIIILTITSLIGMFLPWLAASYAGENVDEANVFNEYFEPTQWILLAGIIVVSILSVLAIILKKKALFITSGVLGIISSVASLGMIFFLASYISSHLFDSYSSIEMGFGTGFYITTISNIIILVFSIISMIPSKIKSDSK